MLKRRFIRGFSGYSSMPKNFYALLKKFRSFWRVFCKIYRQYEVLGNVYFPLNVSTYNMRSFGAINEQLCYVGPCKIVPAEIPK
jgi:hypothetical protein